MALSFQQRDFIPVLLGGDINVYSVARAFFEAYQVKSVCFGRFATGPAYRSLLIDYTADPSINTEEGFDRLVNGFAREHADKCIVLVGCGDEYVALCAQFKDAGRLASNIVAPYGSYSLMEQCQKKEIFYTLCEKHGVPYPHSFTFSRDMLPASSTASISVLDTLDFPYPLILKPSDGIQYWQHPFSGQKKAYTIATRDELERTIRSIYDAGYKDDLILQDFIPGNDENMYVLTSYSDRAGRVRMMCLGHVLLEEHEPHAVGNHAVIITEQNDELLGGVRKLLEDLSYVGFSNFDVKYDPRDGSFKFFDFNTRQGRSNYYVTASGLNVARYMVEEYVYGNGNAVPDATRDLAPDDATPGTQTDAAGAAGAQTGATLGAQKDAKLDTRSDSKGALADIDTAHDEFLWRVVPMGIVDRYVKDPALRARAHKLQQAGSWVNPLFLPGDFTLNRWLRMQKLMLSHFKLFKTYYT